MKMRHHRRRHTQMTLAWATRTNMIWRRAWGPRWDWRDRSADVVRLSRALREIDDRARQAFGELQKRLEDAR